MKLTDVLILDRPFYAHRSDEKKKETLEEHSELCRFYFNRIVKEKQMEKTLQNLWRCYLSSEREELLNFVCYCLNMQYYSMMPEK